MYRTDDTCDHTDNGADSDNGVGILISIVDDGESEESSGGKHATQGGSKDVECLEDEYREKAEDNCADCRNDARSTECNGLWGSQTD